VEVKRRRRDPLPASLGGTLGLPSGLSDPPLGSALLIFLSDPHSWGITVQGRGASAPVGPSDLLPAPGFSIITVLTEP